MPAMWFWAHVRALPKIEATRAYARMNAALATNSRAMDDEGRRSYLRELDEAAAGGRRAAPKANLATLRQLGFNMAPPPEKAKEVNA